MFKRYTIVNNEINELTPDQWSGNIKKCSIDSVVILVDFKRKCKVSSFSNFDEKGRLLKEDRKKLNSLSKWILEEEESCK